MHLIPLPREIVVTGANAPHDGPVETLLDPGLSNLGPEGYTLIAHQEGFRIESSTERGLFYAQATLNELRSGGLIPCCKITDSPAMQMRGIMFDLARCKERHEYYYEMIDLLSQWKINTVFLHLTDHSGCAIEFDCYPNLATPYAFTKNEMRDLIRFAAERHVDLIPEMETWGHAKWITRLPELADLAEDPNDPRALCTLNPRTWEVMGKIIAETAELFPSKYLHAGCDEAAFGKCERCVAMAENEGEGALVGEHVRRVCELVEKNGKVPMVWGDILLGHRESVNYIPKDTIITHWDYKADPDKEPVEFLKSLGYEVVGCPAIVWGSRMILPMADTLDNVERFAEICRDSNCLGMETTIWLPQRYICDTLCFDLAYAAEMSWSGSARSRLDFAQAFAAAFYGVEGDSEFAKALIDVHALSEKSFVKLVDLWAYAVELNDVDQDKFEADIRGRLERARALGTRLRSSRDRVEKHLTEYDTIILSAEIAAHLQERALALRQVVLAVGEGSAAALAESEASLGAVVQREDILLPRIDAAWDRRRYSDDPLKHSTGETLLGAFNRSRQFLEIVSTRLREAASTGAANFGSIFSKPDDQ